MGQLVPGAPASPLGPLPGPLVEPGAADPEAAAALELVGRQVLAGSVEWDLLDADLLWLADPAGGGR